jgi:hypothetical protein
MTHDPPAAHPPIRLVAVDLDGTLLNDSKRVSEQTVGALKCLTGAGVRVVIASARPPRSVRHVYAELGLDTWQINYNGALVWDEPARRAVDHRPMDPSVVRDIVAVARREHPEVIVSCEILDRWCTDRFDATYTTETGRLFPPDVVAPLETFCTEPITKLMLLANPAALSALEPVLRTLAPDAGVNVLRSDPDLIQIMHASASKGAALRQVADHYHVPMEQVMAIGDAVNDVPMLEAAGVAVAMDNAHPDVKRAADWVAPSNNDHGVHAALERYELC